MVNATEEGIRKPAPEIYFAAPNSWGWSRLSAQMARRLPDDGTSAPLLQLIDEMLREIQAAARIRRIRLGLRDLELPDYPERVLREA